MTACPKPARGAYVFDRKKKRAKIESDEAIEKAKVRIRDKRCRWPLCRHKKARLEVAHLRAKGMGGDHGTVSHDYEMVLLCVFHHQADPQEGHPEGSIERHTLQVIPLSDAGTNGPCQFMRQFVRMTPTKLVEEWVEIARESSPGILERSVI